MLYRQPERPSRKSPTTSARRSNFTWRAWPKTVSRSRNRLLLPWRSKFRLRPKINVDNSCVFLSAFICVHRRPILFLPFLPSAMTALPRHLILGLWAVLVCCVIIGFLLPAASPVMVGIGRLHVNDKVIRFGAYLALSLLPVIGFRDRRRGLMAGLSMWILGILMEAGQQFSPGRAVELGDVVANGAGVSWGGLLGLPVRGMVATLWAGRNSL